MKKSKMDVKYLIANEETINWKKLSKDKEFILTPLEAKLFKDKIVWSEYVLSHTDTISTEILEIGKDKIFPTTLTVFLLLYMSDSAEEFIRRNPESINFEFIFLYRKDALSEETLIETRKYWENLPNIKELLAQFLDDNIQRPEYQGIRLIYETL